MGHPIWLTGSNDSNDVRVHDLGRISGLDFFSVKLQAIDSSFASSISYSVISGRLPSGLALIGDTICGNAERIYRPDQKLNEDTTNQFTVRAKNVSDNTITDRTFKISVTGNFPPEIKTPAGLIGNYLDGTDIMFQLEAIDINNDPLTWSLTSGQLPEGIMLNSRGLIYGIMKPIDKSKLHYLGWDGVEWDDDLFELASNSKTYDYNFTASLSDGKSTVSRNYSIQVYLYEGLRSDSLELRVDDILDRADISAVRQPILLTETLGEAGTVNSGGYYAFQFTGVNTDAIPLVFNVVSGNLPPGVTLDYNTGWITGYIPPQVETTKDYTFGIKISSSEDLGNSAPTREFKLTVLGNLDLAVRWITEAELGLVDVGVISKLSVMATVAPRSLIVAPPRNRDLPPPPPIRELGYRLKYGSKLPQGLKLLNDGTISGRISFQTFYMDSGNTTFDKSLANKFVYKTNTTFDNTYSFTVIASDFQNKISAEKTFHLRVNPTTYEPYENLYIRCLPAADLRDDFFSLVNNSDIFDLNDIYRPNDPYYGVQKEIKFLVNYGIKASKLSEYIRVMQTRHYNKVFYFGDYKLAQGKDTEGNILYDVVYVDLIEDTKTYENDKGVILKKSPAPFTTLTNIKPGWTNTRPLPPDEIYLENTRFDVIATNDLTLMQKDISSDLQNSFKNSLPLWMVSVQKNQRTLGFTTGAVLAYLKPNTGAKALFRLKRAVQFDIKNIPFIADRYVLNNNYTENFNIDTGKFYSANYTTFEDDTFDKKSTIFDGRAHIDNYSIPFENDKYLKFPKIGVFTNGQ